MFTIREFNEQTDDDYEAAVAIWNANWPDYLETAAQWKAWHNTRDKSLHNERLIGEIGGQVVCYAEWGEPGWSQFPGKYDWGFDLYPDHNIESTASQIYEHMVAKIVARGGTKLSSGTRSDKPDRIAFLENRDYKLVQTEPTSLLDVAAFDPMAFQKSMERATSEGVKMFSYAQVKALDPNWKRKLWELRWEIHQDVPSSDPPKPKPFEVYAKQLDDPIAVNLSTCYVAVDSTRATTDANGDGDVGPYAALSNLEYSPVDKTMGHTGLTGVARAYRRKGIATAIKVHAISQAKANGIQRIDTENEENNPMLDLNVRLGFKPGPAWLQYELFVQQPKP